VNATDGGRVGSISGRPRFVPDGRFVIWEVDAAEPSNRGGPDRGDDGKGYTVQQLHGVLATRYKMSPVATHVMITAAESRRFAFRKSRA
jgi:hypothetical protein